MAKDSQVELQTSLTHRAGKIVVIAGINACFDAKCRTTTDIQTAAILIAKDKSISTVDPEDKATVESFLTSSAGKSITNAMGAEPSQREEAFSKENGQLKAKIADLQQSNLGLVAQNEQLRAKIKTLEAGRAVAPVVPPVDSKEEEEEVVEEIHDVEKIKEEMMFKTVAELKATAKSIGLPEKEYSKMSKKVLVDYLIEKTS